MTYRIKGWTKFQHFKDRTPPWVKLYRELLDDPDWFCLSGDDAKVLVSLWLIASEDKEHKGSLPEPRKLAFRLRISEKELNQTLTRLSHWLIQDDISVISERYQVDAPETETETEKEGETEKAQDKPARVRFDPMTVELPDCVSSGVWTQWVQFRKESGKKLTEASVSQQLKNLEQWKREGHDVNAILKTSIANGWSGLFAPRVTAKPSGIVDNTAARDAQKAAWRSAVLGGEIGSA